MEPGLSSELERSHEGPFSRFATVRPTEHVNPKYSDTHPNACALMTLQ